MDAESLRVVADLARKRAMRGGYGVLCDGMARLGARKVLLQFAKDLEISADELDRPTRKRRRH